MGVGVSELFLWRAAHPLLLPTVFDAAISCRKDPEPRAASACTIELCNNALTNYYWPCAKIGGNCYKLSASMSTEKEAMEFLRNLVGKIENSSTTK